MQLRQVSPCKLKQLMSMHLPLLSCRKNLQAKQLPFETLCPSHSGDTRRHYPPDGNHPNTQIKHLGACGSGTWQLAIGATNISGAETSSQKLFESSMKPLTHREHWPLANSTHPLVKQTPFSFNSNLPWHCKQISPFVWRQLASMHVLESRRNI